MFKSYLYTLIVAVILMLGRPAHAGDGAIVVQSTTSTRNSGLYEYLLPKFTADTGMDVHVVAVGTGQALKNAENCDGDVLLVHAKKAEDAFVANGYGVERFDLMSNDFVIVGPAADPAEIAGMNDPFAALKAIADAKAAFISRGDDSGTHKKELSLWRAAGIDPVKDSGTWYREVGAGMGAALNIAVGMDGYILTDRATWIAFNNKGDYDIMVEGDENLFNQYGVILVDPDHCPSTAAKHGQVFIDWLLSDAGQQAIAAYRLDGKQLFFPNAN